MIVMREPNVLICGDSWARGEWNVECTQILHKGIEQYFSDDGIKVTNISKGGISNLDIIDRIANFLENSNLPAVTHIIVFQTEFTRDLKHHRRQHDYGADDWAGIEEIEHFADRLIERFYQRLSELSKNHDIPIFLVGGCSDTKQFTDMSCDYPGCEIVCQSMTNLIINHDSNIQDPVFSWYSSNTQEFVERIRSLLPQDKVDNLIHDIDKGYERACLLHENPDWFYPDGQHPNRHGHFVLYQLLKSKIFSIK